MSEGSLLIPPFLGPRLARPLPWTPLGRFPTPVRRLDVLGRARACRELWLKDDGLASPLYGGNKVRKLEFLLGRALARKRKSIHTFGALGSHHALATAIFGAVCKLEVELTLYPQPLNRHVLDNLLLYHYFGARLTRLAHPGLLPVHLSLRALRRGSAPAGVIPPGGSDALGTMGYVEGGLELCAQVQAGALPPPDYIFVAAGTCGTAAGLALGLQIGGLDKTKIIAVQVVESVITNPLVLGSLVRFGGRLLRRHGLSLRAGAGRRLSLISEQLGGGYGHATEASRAAVSAAKDDGLILDPTYTGKALAGLLGFVEEHGLEGRRHLFWNTYSQVDLSDKVALIKAADLPAPFRDDFRAYEAALPPSKVQATSPRRA